MIRLIVTDIDGTLVPEGGKLKNPDRYMRVIRELTDRGVLFGAASGRQVNSVDAVFHEVRDRIFYLSDNGALVQRGGKIIHEERMDEEDLRAFWEDARQIPGCHVLLSGLGGCFVNEENTPFSRMIQNKYRLGAKFAKRIEDHMDNVIKFSIYSEEGAFYLKDRLYDRWKDKFAVVVSGKFWLDVNGPKSEKGNAVRIIQEMNGISPDETVVFGDNFNDISMFRRAKQSYASVLSHEDVKAVAAYEVASYEEDGVLHELERILEEIKMQ